MQFENQQVKVSFSFSVRFLFRKLYFALCILYLVIVDSVDKTRLLLFCCGGHFLLGPLRGPLGLPLAQMGWFGLTGRTTSWLNRTHRSAHQLRPPLINLINWLCTAFTMQPIKFEEACYEKTQWREVTQMLPLLIKWLWDVILYISFSTCVWINFFNEGISFDRQFFNVNYVKWLKRARIIFNKGGKEERGSIPIFLNSLNGRQPSTTPIVAQSLVPSPQ